MKTKLEAVREVLGIQGIEDELKEIAVHAILHGADIGDVIQTVGTISHGHLSDAFKDLVVASLKALSSPTPTTTPTIEATEAKA